jgi:hypothetical protein
VLIVAKKNVNTLDCSLGDAISSLCQRIPASDVPLLIIDDEFDEASVQRNRGSANSRKNYPDMG